MQGERDPFGRSKEVAEYRLSESIDVDFLPDGDHDLKPRKASGRTPKQNWEDAIEGIVAFIHHL
jgi:predicted alpha/beta-hydrolase family hydrolase